MGGKEKIRICKQYSTKKIEDWELNEKIKRKAHVKQSFSLDFLERGTFTEYPYVSLKKIKKIVPLLLESCGTIFFHPYIYFDYFFVIRNQSTSAQPPSFVLIAGRVQNIPTLAPIHCPSLAWKGTPNDSYFFPSRL